MSTDDKELIDLNRLSQRELLILLHQDVKELKTEMKEGNERDHKMALRVNSLETRNKVLGGVSGFIGGIISGIIAALFSK